MAMGKATYSYKNVTDCIEKIEVLNCTVAKKKQHCFQCWEVGKVFDFCYEKTNCCLFNTRYSCWETYSKLVSLDIEHKKISKKELDRALKDCIRFLQNEIRDIYNMMEKGEVNTTL